MVTDVTVDKHHQEKICHMCTWYNILQWKWSKTALKGITQPPLQSKTSSEIGLVFLSSENSVITSNTTDPQMQTANPHLQIHAPQECTNTQLFAYNTQK